MREARWLWALTLRRWRRLFERLLTDSAVRKQVLGASLGVGGGFVPFIWLMLAGRGGGGGRPIDYPEADALALVIGAIWLMLAQGPLSGTAIILPRPGLSLMLGGPITGRGLITWWMSRAWVGSALIHVLLTGWVCSRLFAGALYGSRLASIALATGLCALTALGLIGTGASTHHRLSSAGRFWLRAAAWLATGWLVVVALHVIFHGERTTIFPDPYNAYWLTAIDGTLAVMGTVLAPVGSALTAYSPGVVHVPLAVIAGGALTLCFALAGQLDVTAVLEASSARAEAMKEAKRTVPKARRASKLSRFGRGPTALVWKALAESEARHGRLALVAGWVMLIAIGIALAWLMDQSIAHLGADGPEWVIVLFTSLATAVACAAGGTNGIGLGTEVRHLTWLVRYPLRPTHLLGAVAGLPAAMGVVVLLVLLGPSLVTAGEHRGTVAIAIASGTAISLGVRMLRVLVWLRFPPPQSGPSTLSGLLHGAAFAFPLGLAGVTGWLLLFNTLVPVPIALALAGTPSLVIAGLGWPAAVGSMRRLEMG